MWGTVAQVQEYLMQLMIKLEKDKAELQIDAANLDHDKVCAAHSERSVCFQPRRVRFAGAGAKKCPDSFQESRRC